MALAIDWINTVREVEFSRVLSLYRARFEGADVLELGSGTGIQLKAISKLAKSAVGIDLKNGDYSSHRIANVLDYDGATIPFPDSSFDLIFSSNVLEHLTDEERLYSEMARVLRPGGTAIHVVPTCSWRFWCWISHYPDMAIRLLGKLRPTKNPNSTLQNQSPETRKTFFTRLRHILYPERHGEKGNAFTEFFWLRTAKWKARLESHGWKVDNATPSGLWYTGNVVMAEKISVRTRSRLARVFESSTIVIEASPKS
ncbi:MAG TPA: class I SAM-dependent methyltransferase [Candidatus Angelobacter sp.]|jgi:SAM-dependent methyltransferase